VGWRGNAGHIRLNATGVGKKSLHEDLPGDMQNRTRPATLTKDRGAAFGQCYDPRFSAEGGRVGTKRKVKRKGRKGTEHMHRNPIASKRGRESH